MISFISLKLRKSFLIQRANGHPRALKTLPSSFHAFFPFHPLSLRLTLEVPGVYFAVQSKR